MRPPVAARALLAKCRKSAATWHHALGSLPRRSDPCALSWRASWTRRLHACSSLGADGWRTCCMSCCCPHDRVQESAAALTPLLGDALVGAASVDTTAINEGAESAALAAAALDTDTARTRRLQRSLAVEEEGEAAEHRCVHGAHAGRRGRAGQHGRRRSAASHVRRGRSNPNRDPNPDLTTEPAPASELDPKPAPEPEPNHQRPTRQEAVAGGAGTHPVRPVRLVIISDTHGFEQSMTNSSAIARHARSIAKSSAAAAADQPTQQLQLQQLQQ
eukprot:scaffold110458_cov63-Phaeocystis_antarctica.AAC.2